MKQNSIIIIIIFGAFALYCAKILLEASIVVPCDSAHAYSVITGLYDVLTWLVIILLWDRCTEH